MRIVGGHIDRFGFYQDQDLPELQEGLVLVVGDNESGKTTLLEFIRQTLFGYKEARQHPYYDSGGPPSGTLRLVLADGETRTIARRGARGSATLRDPTGGPLPSAELEAILGGMTDEGFRNLFAITLDELRALDSKAQADIEALLLGASFGVSPEAYNDAVKDLDAEAKALLTIRGTNQPANAAAIACREAMAEARRIGHAVAQFSDKAEKFERLRNRANELDGERTRAIAQLNRAGRLVEAWSTWVELQRKSAALDAVPAVPKHDYDEALRRYEAARVDIAEMLEELEGVDADVAQAAHIRDAQAPNEALIGEGPEIRTAISKLSGWREARQRAEQEQADAAAVRRELEDALDQLGLPRGDEGLKQALALKTGVQATNLLTQARSRLEAAESVATDARRAHDGAKRDAKKAEEEVNDAEAQLPEPPPEPAIPEDGLRAFQERRVQARTAAREAETSRTAVESKRRKLEVDLGRTAPDWSLSDLAGFDPVAARTEIAPVRASSEEAETDARQASRALETARSNVRAATARLDEAKAEARAAAPETESLDAVEERLTLLHEARSACEAAEAEAAAASHVRRWSPVGLGLAFASIAALLLAVGLFAAEVRGGAAAAAVVGLLLLLVAAGLFVRTPEERTARPAARRRDKVLQQIGYASPPRPGALEQQVAALEGARRAFLRVEERSGQARMAEEQLEAEEAADQAARRARDEALRTLDGVYESLRIPEPARPDAFGFLFSLDGLLREVQRIDGDEAEAARHEADWQAFVDEVRALDPSLPKDAGQEAVDAAAQALIQQGEASLAAREERKRKVDWIEERRRVAKNLSKEERSRRVAAESAAKAFSKARDAWRSQLREQGFKAGLDPEGALRAQDLAGEVRKLHSRQVQTDRRVAATQEVLDEFEDRCGELLKRLGRPVPDSSALEPALRALDDELREALSTKDTLDQANRDFETAQETKRSLEKRIGNRRQRQADVLSEAECPDLACLRQRAATAKERESLKQEVERLRREALAESGEADETRLAEVLEGHDLESLERRQASLEAEVRTVSDERDGILKQCAELEVELNGLRGEEGREKHLALAESYRTEARTAARKWLRARLALWMLEEARQTFERDHQPQVLVKAGELFSVITDRRWNWITRSVEGGGELAVHAGEEAGTAAAILSRGAREQLYFALRLANALQPRAKGEPLPLVLDDVLVNFDEGRARKSLRALASAAEERQILLFTCHDWVRSLVEKQATGAQIVRLNRGEFVEP